MSLGLTILGFSVLIEQAAAVFAGLVTFGQPSLPLLQALRCKSLVSHEPDGSRRKGSEV